MRSRGTSSSDRRPIRPATAVSSMMRTPKLPGNHKLSDRGRSLAHPKCLVGHPPSGLAGASPLGGDVAAIVMRLTWTSPMPVTAGGEIGKVWF